MRNRNMVLKFIVFGFAFGLGLAAAALMAPSSSELSFEDALSRIKNSGGGRGVAVDRAPGGPVSIMNDTPSVATRESEPTNVVRVKILSKPKAAYTDEARNNNVQGTVTLKIAFLASGEIGGITVVSGLPDGLTERAIEAAKQIKFEPKKVNGQPVSVVMTLQYGFNIY